MNPLPHGRRSRAPHLLSSPLFPFRRPRRSRHCPALLFSFRSRNTDALFEPDAASLFRRSRACSFTVLRLSFPGGDAPALRSPFRTVRVQASAPARPESSECRTPFLVPQRERLFKLRTYVLRSARERQEKVPHSILFESHRSVSPRSVPDMSPNTMPHACSSFRNGNVRRRFRTPFCSECKDRSFRIMLRHVLFSVRERLFVFRTYVLRSAPPFPVPHVRSRPARVRVRERRTLPKAENAARGTGAAYRTAALSGVSSNAGRSRHRAVPHFVLHSARSESGRKT